MSSQLDEGRTGLLVKLRVLIPVSKEHKPGDTNDHMQLSEDSQGQTKIGARSVTTMKDERDQNIQGKGKTVRL
jgi:hypothetical protein